MLATFRLASHILTASSTPLRCMLPYGLPASATSLEPSQDELDKYCLRNHLPAPTYFPRYTHDRQWTCAVVLPTGARCESAYWDSEAEAREACARKALDVLEGSWGEEGV